MRGKLALRTLGVCMALMVMLTGTGVASARSDDGPAKPAGFLAVSAQLKAARGALKAAAVVKQAAASGPPSPPYTECPAVGADTSCEILVDVTNAGQDVLQDNSQGPFDGGDDTLIGVLNNSSSTVTSLGLSASTDIFGFDGDGICSGDYNPAPSGCPFGPTGYEGPNTSFSNINADQTGGDVDFSPGIPPGGTAYFSLEEPLSSNTVFSGGPSPAEQGQAPNESENSTTCSVAQPVNCATGTFWHTFTDASVPGLGVPLDFTRTYSSANASTNGPLGYGWSDSYGMSLSFDASGDATITQEDGSTITFDDTGGSYVAPPWVLATFVADGNGSYTLTRDSTNIQYVFNSSGQLISEVDRNGYATTLSYDGSGDLTSVTDQAGRSLTLSYSAGHLVSVTDPDGKTTSYSYDASGNLAGTTDPLGRTWSFTYDANHLLLSMTDPDGGTTTNTYNGSNQVVRQVDPMGRTTTWSYSGNTASSTGGTTTITDPDGNETVHDYSNMELMSVTQAAGTSQAATSTYAYDPATLGRTQITDPDGHTTTNTYDSRGDLLATTDPLGNETQYTYDSDGDLLSETDPLGTTTTYSYDSDGNLLSKSRPLSGEGNATWTYTYGSGPTAGELLSSTDPDGNTTTYGYDTAGDQTSVTDALGNTTTMTYDSDGRLLSTTTPDGGKTSDSYDADGELTKTTNPLGKTTSYTYDGDGTQTSVTDANGNKTSYSYDKDNEQTEITEPDGSTNKTTYDSDGNTLTQADGNGHTTTYTYNPLNQAASTTDPDGHQTTYTYDGAGNLLTTVDPSGHTTTYSYDADNHLTGINYSDGTTPNVTESYDAEGNRTSITDGTGTSSYSYNTLGNLSSYTNGAGQTISYSYDLAGDITSITYPNGQTINRAYNADEQLKSITDWMGNTTTFGYDDDGSLTSEDLPGSVTSTSTYDANDQLTGITDKNSSGTIANFSYTRDPVGQVTGSTASGALSGTDSYSYDAENRLTADNSTTYGYDLANNLTTYGAKTQTFEPANELQTSTTNLSTSGGAPSTPTPTSGGTASTSSVSSPTTATPPTKTTAPSLGSSQAKAGKVIVESVTATHKITKRRTLSATVTTKQTGDLLLALIAAQGPASRAQTGSVPVARGVKWTLVTRAGAHGQSASIWQARPTRKLERAIITARLGQPSSQALLTLVVFGPGTTLGAHAGAARNTGAPTLKLEATVGSQIWAIGHDGASTKAPTPLAGQQLTEKITSRPSKDASWVQHTTVAHTAATTIGDRASRSTSWTLAATTVQPTAASGSSADPRALLSGETSSNPGSPTTRTFTYNPEGDRTSVTTDGSSVTLGYDQANRLTSIGPNITYTYNGDSLRISKTVDGTTTQFAWDESGSLPLLLQDGATSYIYGPDGQPVEQVTDSTPTYFLADQQGSTRLLIGDNGTVVGTYSYDPWGTVTSHTGTASTNLQYDGQYTDSETGFQYLRARYYDPSTGQFLTVDPDVSQTQNAYGYTQDEPISERDPGGADILDDVLGTTADEAFHAVVTTSKDLSKVKVLGLLDPVSDIETVVSAGNSVYDCGAWGVDTLTGDDGHTARLECGGSSATTANNALGLIPVAGAGISAFLDEITSEGQAGSDQGWYDDNPCDPLYGHTLYP